MSGIVLKGIHSIAMNKSLMARFSKNTFVTVLIRLFWTNVKITSMFPTTDNTKMRQYNGISIFHSNVRAGISYGLKQLLFKQVSFARVLTLVKGSVMFIAGIITKNQFIILYYYKVEAYYQINYIYQTQYKPCCILQISILLSSICLVREMIIDKSV